MIQASRLQEWEAGNHFQIKSAKSMSRVDK